MDGWISETDPLKINYHATETNAFQETKFLILDYIKAFNDNLMIFESSPDAGYRTSLSQLSWLVMDVMMMSWDKRKWFPVSLYFAATCKQGKQMVKGPQVLWYLSPELEKGYVLEEKVFRSSAQKLIMTQNNWILGKNVICREDKAGGGSAEWVAVFMQSVRDMISGVMIIMISISGACDNGGLCKTQPGEQRMVCWETEMRASRALSSQPWRDSVM